MFNTIHSSAGIEFIKASNLNSECRYFLSDKQIIVVITEIGALQLVHVVCLGLFPDYVKTFPFWASFIHGEIYCDTLQAAQVKINENMPS